MIGGRKNALILMFTSLEFYYFLIYEFSILADKEIDSFKLHLFHSRYLETGLLFQDGELNFKPSQEMIHIKREYNHVKISNQFSCFS